MTDYWTHFAHTGHPEPPRRSPPVFRDRAPLAQSLAPGHDGLRPLDVGTAHHCAFWNGHRG
ncbi:hypothetical protein [Streptomyces hiroshimensis]|uniref:Carboxylesterase n=1 Tax=Streptomyces hiroshimensis TaxID=66424 RepID=A0ABQ2YA37_9ACTN|nr:hypothetical protein [Streptomyces hiroshimensis]GGX76253.1 hypothetical protein GCM10010324_22380 [Streptomyces hiroshimensis]